MEKIFHLGDVLSVIDGRLVAPRGMEAVYDILNFMTGDNLFTHVLPRAVGVCGPVLLQQFPDLERVDWDGLTEQITTAKAMTCGGDEDVQERVKLTVELWLAAQTMIYGESFSVAPLKGWDARNPLEELVSMVGADRVIIVAVD